MFDTFKKKTALDAVKQAVKRLMSAQGEANAQSMASKLIALYQGLDNHDQIGFFAYLLADFNPPVSAVSAAAAAYCAAPSAEHLIRLFEVVEPPRQELFRRINRAAGGTVALIQMRQQLFAAMRQNLEFRAIDADMHHLLSSWFNPGFLELHQITWDSPAKLLEKIIQHESVHAVDGWDDLRRRLQPDRRCYAFFHRQLANEPLIFVEVALVPEIATQVGVLLDKQAAVLDKKQYKTAIFYSISNCQPGLRGVSLGNFLIKRVADKLLEEMPSLKTFSTLSPIPGLVRWLEAGAPLNDVALSAAQIAAVAAARARLPNLALSPNKVSEEGQQALLLLGAYYLRYYTLSAQGDPVAKFHLSNGATLHQINWAADLSKKGLAQSAGLMVNYLYELDKVEQQHEVFIKGEIHCGKKIIQLTR